MRKFVSVVLVAALMLSMSAVALADTYGLGISTGIGSSKAATADKDGTAQVDSTVCALVLDDEGKIKSIKFDVAQTKVAFNAKGEITADVTAEIRSKVELKDDYGMRKASTLEKGEWFEQAAAFEAYCMGKTVEEVLGMETYDKGDGHHTTVPAGEDVKATVTLDVGGFLASLAKAAESAK
ncbi:MAG: hypothetical protein PHQ85_09960 [Eubacteriales bacterium]|jgi:hypothetical protein|nr:hypothetical protein [Eubacteriales bacterium]MDD4106216.1 hypothetical protein [Eubacteriales bacterium]MDD4711563.1 hypothetical protein [Eubacteriales bacterium]NLO16363.1 hypothetical protein [Clostridiales bacterium]